VGERGEKKWMKAGRWLAVVVAGALVGSVLIGPAMAHLNNPPTFAHLKKHFFTKKQANSKFINVGEKASDSDKLDGKNSTEFLATGGKAADSDKLDGLDGSAFLQNTQLGWAIVLANGTLVRGVNTTSAANLGSPGNYEVVFNRDVSQCMYQATISDSALGAEIGAQPRTGNANAVFVTTWLSNGNPADKPFHLFVICG